MPPCTTGDTSTMVPCASCCPMKTGAANGAAATGAWRELEKAAGDANGGGGIAEGATKVWGGSIWGGSCCGRSCMCGACAAPGLISCVSCSICGAAFLTGVAPGVGGNVTGECRGAETGLIAGVAGMAAGPASRPTNLPGAVMGMKACCCSADRNSMKVFFTGMEFMLPLLSSG